MGVLTEALLPLSWEFDTDDSGVELEQEDSDTIVEPYDPSNVRISSRSMTISLIESRLSYNEIQLDPDFQRRAGIWNLTAQSRLIESLLIRIPLPAFYFDATNDDYWVVIDGLQRLTAINKYIHGEYPLVGLEYLKNHNGLLFNELDRKLQRRILETEILAFVVERDTPKDVKFNIFKRINTGGLPLSPQEIRNALYQGQGTKLLNQLASSDVFRKATDGGVKTGRMSDRECVLRFLAFLLTPYKEYSKNLETFLNEALQKLNQQSPEQIYDLERRFYRSMDAAIKIFDNRAFRKPLETRTAINKPLFEAWSVTLDQNTDAENEVLISKREELYKSFKEIYQSDRTFAGAITGGTGSPSSVQKRFTIIENIVKETRQ